MIKTNHVYTMTTTAFVYSTSIFQLVIAGSQKRKKKNFNPTWNLFLFQAQYSSIHLSINTITPNKHTEEPWWRKMMMMTMTMITALVQAEIEAPAASILLTKLEKPARRENFHSKHRKIKRKTESNKMISWKRKWTYSGLLSSSIHPYRRYWEPIKNVSIATRHDDDDSLLYSIVLNCMSVMCSGVCGYTYFHLSSTFYNYNDNMTSVLHTLPTEFLTYFCCKHTRV